VSTKCVKISCAYNQLIVGQLVKLGAMSIYFDTDAGSLDKGAKDRQGTIDAVKSMVSYF